MIQNCIKCDTMNVVSYWDELKCIACGHDQQPKITTPPQPVKTAALRGYLAGYEGKRAAKPRRSNGVSL